MYEEGLKQLDLFSLETKRLRRYLTHVYKYLLGELTALICEENHHMAVNTETKISKTRNVN